jgi:hypothetical protein
MKAFSHIIGSNPAIPRVENGMKSDAIVSQPRAVVQENRIRRLTIRKLRTH